MNNTRNWHEITFRTLSTGDLDTGRLENSADFCLCVIGFRLRLVDGSLEQARTRVYWTSCWFSDSTCTSCGVRRMFCAVTPLLLDTTDCRQTDHDWHLDRYRHWPCYVPSQINTFLFVRDHPFMTSTQRERSRTATRSGRVWTEREGGGSKP